MSDSFVHLHVHSEYSIADSLLRVRETVNRAAELGMPAIALTELHNLFSVVKFYRAAEEAGIKPIIGAEITVADEASSAPRGRMVMLCQDIHGYHNLCHLITESYVNGQINGVPTVNISWLNDYNDGLIALCSARHGDVTSALRHGNIEYAKESINYWKSLFSDRYVIEAVRGNREDDILVDQTLRLTQEYDVPVIASNDVRFMHRDDYDAHEVRVCIQQGRSLTDPRRIREYTESQYLRSSHEMRELFSDYPEILDNTLRIAERCNLILDLDKPNMPDYPVPAGYDQDSLLVEEAYNGLRERVIARAQLRHGEVDEAQYQSRLQRELDVITSMGFSGYFLIVSDFIRWAKSENIPVGPGRGSGAGSLVAYALGITALDPLDYDLLFERFLNPERVSLPDFDIDFCMERRDEVIAYVAKRYGRNQVSQIITYGSMAAKAVVRDVGRALGHAYGFVDQIAKLIPFEIGMTLDKALQEEPSLKERYDSEEDVTILIDLACKLEGLCRNAGRHAGGVVIAPKPLIEYMPLYAEQGSESTVTQFDMGDVEAIGLVKFDFLGLRTLTIIEWAVRDINARRSADGEELLDITTIPLDDKQAFKLVQRTDTMAVFQLESEGMRKLIKRLQPDSFEDMVALVALFRPGPLQSGMVDDFVDRKHGRSKIHYPHPALEPILKPTYGVILYQEQVMQIAQTLAGYTLGAADLLRRAMGKKKPEEMAKQRDIFVSGSIANNVDKDTAVYIFDLMEKFAGYGFNKSHSAAYALVAYQTAWLKAHYPAAFMAAVLSSDMDNTDKVVQLREELRRMNLDLLPPNVNQSLYEFSVSDDNSVRYGLGAVRGVGRNAVEAIIDERKNGFFSDLFDFCRRCDSRKVNRRVLEALVRCGALDDFGHHRSSLMASLDKALHYAEQSITNDRLGQNDLFGLGSDKNPDAETNTIIEMPEWADDERLQNEKDTLGFYLHGHPIIKYETELSQFISNRLDAIQPGDTMVVIAGYIASIRIRNGRRGRMAEVRLDDRSATVPVTVYNEAYQNYRNLLIKDNLVIIRGKVERDEFYEIGYTVTVNEVLTLDSLRSERATLLLTISSNSDGKALLQPLKELLASYRDEGSPVIIDYHNGQARARLKLGDNWRVRPENELIDRLHSFLGTDNVRICYGNLKDQYN
ncbi:DNA polymerase-3 subunit alpha [Methylohalomonas lacus]|uniref:DNA polymerase III subunit alpha n=1 Tax=Methylohalomonas lacus TaxID=398773 RepID=A0AAE3L521_9GAMM|nr:DNA polymerase III subunit alpha [Methylohalomonas lacus]MCS3902532.1 DNA polymerase-3 subunit alpha [Methylohalomonas lacus]